MADYEAPFEGTAPPARRRPSRVRSADDTPHSAAASSAGTDDGGSKISKTSRRTLRKAPKSHTSAAPEPIYEEEGAHWEDNSVGHMPHLGQIHEGLANTASRSRSSTTGSTRRRHSEDNTNRMRVRPKQGSLGRGAGSLAKHSNSSLTSVFSGLTQPSTASESNTTITDKSNRDERRRKDKSIKGAKVKRSKRSAAPSVADTEVTHSEVFQFLEEDPHGQDTHGDAHSVLQASSPSVISSLDSRADDKSSDASEGGHDTPRTSPTSTRRSHSHGTSYYGQYKYASRKPLYASSFVHGPGDEPAEDSEVSSDEESTYDDDHAQYPPPSAPYWGCPPMNAAHPRSGHVHQSPQPHHTIPYAGVMSPNMQSAVPSNDSRMYSGAPPANFSSTASQASAWPLNVSFPQPLAIAYSPETGAAYLHHSPVASHAPPNVLQSPVAAHAVAAQHMAMTTQHSSHRKSGSGNDTMIGYELLAHKLSELKKGRKDDAVVPAYRKFEQLNHRVLLHLQDEISELEEELRQLDQEIAEASPGAQTGHRHPASRRGDTQFGNDLHRQRLDVLGRVFLKLEQYNKALSAFSEVKQLPSARPSDVEKYRAWMKQRNPIHEAESRFLERQADLVNFSSKRHASIDHSAGTNQHANMWLPLFPFVAFSIVPSLLGRIVVIALISAVGLRTVTSTPEFMAIMTVREWMYTAFIYFGLMSVLAVLVR